MPTYDYECESCGHEFEMFQNMTAKTLRKCPECGKNKLQRLIGPGAGVIFKGSGFYETDYRSESYKKGASADKTSPSTDKKTSKSEAKPEAGAKDAAKPAKKDD